MRIAFLSTFYPYRGGIAQFGGALYKALEQQGHEVKAFTFSRQYPDFLFPGKSQYVDEKDNSDHIPSEELLDSINPLTYLKTAKEIRAYQPDVLVTQFWMSFFGPSCGTVAHFVGKDCKVVGILHNVIPHEGRFFDKPFTKYFLKPHDAFVTMSEAVESDLRKYEPMKPSALRPHPLYDHFGEIEEKDEARRTLKINEELKTILFFGFIRDYKGLDLLIEAFGLMDDSYQLVIAGEVYGSFESYDKLIQENKNKERIHCFNQYISDQEVATYFSASDVCVLPYRSATQSGVTAVSLHFEVPLIATDVGGLKELIKPGETGEIVAEADVNLLFDGIERFFENDAAVYQGHIQDLKVEMSWDKFGENLIQFIEKLP
ncbi:glycosyltransferase [Flammeovirga sp. EKP202]|uniref:glycosyltransferase n=1 Tax=Flammeovirga sp. EKP202 TaxID=2770592 RepID=UPI00165FF6FF|nr:glycosyltransferase [Flammeovirga sp. EKP202]MBD0403314.1 glycosyltransferase [Flammeovirga sp. EKP202]